jgi:hypothetical protein
MQSLKSILPKMRRGGMKYFLFSIILVGCLGFVFSLLTSATGVSMVFLAPVVIATIIARVKSSQNSLSNNILSNILLFSVLTIFFYGCTVKVPMTPDVRNIEYKEKLPVTAGLLISENTRQYVFRGNPESFTGGARPHEFPLGETLELASKLIFAELFEDVSLIRRLEEGQRFKLIIKPQIDDFHFRYDQLSHAGFAVSCLSSIKVTITLYSDGSKIWGKTVESPEVRKGPWMLNVDYERDLGESASEALIYTLNQLALEIARDESLRAHIFGQKPIVPDLPQEKQVIAATAEPAPTAKTADQPQETPKVASIPQDAPVVRVALRRQPIELSNQMEITEMLFEYDFFDSSRNVYGSFVNHFIDNNDGTITDKATGLMWQKSGSLAHLDNWSAKYYIERLNHERFAGHLGWRMPTVEELASLLTRRRENGVHIAQVFDYKQTRCWTIDKSDSVASHLRGCWIIDFQNGEVSQASWHWRRGVGAGGYSQNSENYVKAVRSVK